MSKYVSKTKAGKSISAYVILKGKRQVATVRVHYGDTGRVLVNVWQDSDAYTRSARKAGYKVSDREAHDLFAFQYASAGGGGYDKLTAALGGMWIDGHKLTDHCAVQKIPPKGSCVFPVGYTAPKGYTLANWRSDKAGWGSCFRLSGLDYLKDRGYIVVQAI